ncbi:MAG: hypothetical protein V7637_408 [Mycobacteriales bacterium]
MLTKGRILSLALVGLVAAGINPAAATAGSAGGGADRPGCATASLARAVRLPAVTVVSAAPNTGGTFRPPGSPVALTGLPAFCDVVLSRASADGHPITVELWLPTGWNGRFQGVGGGGYVCGVSYPALAAAIGDGYASASTDCGVQDPTGGFALNPDGTLNLARIVDFSSAGIHDMTTAGKAVTAVFYGGQPRYSYFTGCSTGGREGLMEAQRYPADYDGILSAAPAINWTKFIPSELWPELVMLQANDFLPACKEAAFTAAAISACDPLDGVTDGIISDLAACRWDPHALVGTQTPCGQITATDATVMARIWQGPTTPAGTRLWYGLERGASLAGLAGTSTSAAGVTTGLPFPIAVTYVASWLLQDPTWDWRTLTYPEFVALFTLSIRKYGRVIATDDPDLSGFRDRGGKVIMWHGLADQLIFPRGTVDYYQRVLRTMGGPRRTESFARLFLAPGVAHCGGGAGPAPANPLRSLVAWVEHRQAPDTLPATRVDPATNTVTLSRPLCRYPRLARYTGTGDPTRAENFACSPRRA